MEITTVGLDIAKRVFQLHGVDAAGKAVLRRKLQRSLRLGRPQITLGTRSGVGSGW